MRKAVPNVLTMLNLALGIMALLLTIDGYVEQAAIAVIFGMLFDGIDGRVARALHVQSEFGKEFDSLADIVTFGVAPAAIMYVVALREMGYAGDLIAVLFPVAGALRLARFNIATGATNYFVGLPITAAGGILATFTLYHGLIPPTWLPYLTVALSYLMVSRTRYPNFKKIGVPRSAFVVLPLLIMGAAVIAIGFREVVPRLVLLILAVYGGYGIWYDLRLTMRKRLRKHENSNRTQE